MARWPIRKLFLSRIVRPALIPRLNTDMTSNSLKTFSCLPQPYFLLPHRPNLDRQGAFRTLSSGSPMAISYSQSSQREQKLYIFFGFIKLSSHSIPPFFVTLFLATPIGDLATLVYEPFGYPGQPPKSWNFSCVSCITHSKSLNLIYAMVANRSKALIFLSVHSMTRGYVTAFLSSAANSMQGQPVSQCSSGCIVYGLQHSLPGI